MSKRPFYGPTSMVINHALLQPGYIISWSEAQEAYRRGTVKGKPARSRHFMSIWNVLKRHFVKVEGARGLHVLKSSMENPNEAEDRAYLELFHTKFGCDEYGMSVFSEADVRTGRLLRMSQV